MSRKRVLPLAALLLCVPALTGTVPASAAALPGSVGRSGPLRILLTNDDGYDAPGIRLLFDRLTAAGHEVTIVAPLTNQSGAGTKLMSGPAVRVEHPEPRVWAVDGTPGDAVSFGLAAVFRDRAPDLVVSGTNFGPNVAALATHSGTVGGAVAALERGVPALAVSTGELAVPVPQQILNAVRPTGDFAVKLIDRLRDRARGGRLLPEHVGLHVNHPVVGADGTGTARGVSVTTQDPQLGLGARYTDSGDGTWKVDVALVPAPAGRGGDVEAVGADRVSVTPITPDWSGGTADRAAAAALLKGLRP
ncbi:5'-nucleotidase /3'-nucleotidase /exopolyphosphatase [Streptomyces sp. 3211.6]|uniref:5'/3'-nucleotidase SurE n=1 Tax=Streptomyces sp. 3211.6 TaxID=1938845 RepID=UPI000F23EB14|nr:5'/3'-nucleotidase SurE [Streptomyces sp. 3211.6]RKT08515.1 5'-nucleotidase /3'-nucleotidase /exopolyphosphatase [Streptomyces sp. 3211.6]